MSNAAGLYVQPTIFLYFTAQTLRTFLVSFPLLQQGPPLDSFNFTFIFLVFFTSVSAGIAL